MKTWIVGDIHGYNEPLVELLKKVEFDYENDKLISMGDLCDRGPDTWEVIETLRKVKNLVLIIGNHDGWLYDHLRNKNGWKNEQVWFGNGGNTTVMSYENHYYENREEHILFLEKGQPYYVFNNICFVHGGFDRNHLIEEHDVYSLCWDRELVQQAMSAGKNKLVTKDNFDLIFVGHTPTIYWNESVPGKGTQPIYTPIFSGGIWNVDTGCGKGGPLTLFNLDDMTYIQSKEKYYSLQ